jgi:hypothetical protein
MTAALARTTDCPFADPRGGVLSSGAWKHGRFIADYLTPPLPWLSALAGAVLVVIALELVYRIGMKALTQAVAKTSTPLDDVLLRRMRLPAQVLVFLAGAHTLFALHGEENAVVSKAV